MSIEAILLGIAQDGGVPQSGCACENCRRAWRHPAARQLVVCLALVDRASGRCWLVDATPDFREQWHALQEIVPGCALAGIMLTHAHVGHYTGLIHLGREMMGARRVPVYATPACAAFLQRHAPWSQLVALGHIQLHLLSPGQEHRLRAEGLAGLSVTPLPVPHRNEFSDTVGLLVRGPVRRLLYCPDVDSWDRWERDLRGLVEDVDVALLDGTFFSADELGGRDMAEVPHPLVTDTAARLAGLDADVRLIHLNHTNPLLAPGPEQDWLAAQGLRVAAFGDRWELG